METQKNIKDELMGISPAVANIGNINVFTVPEGYFQSVTDEIYSNLFILALPTNNPLTPPPAEYFNDLAGNILTKISSSPEKEKNLLNDGRMKENIFSIPTGFFDQLPAQIMQQIKAEENSVEKELEETAPFLNTIGRKNVYAVPAGYFEGLAASITLHVKKEKAKVIGMGAGFKRIMGYAAAASVAAIMLFTGYQFFYTEKHSTEIAANKSIIENNINIQSAISSVSDEEINHYLDTHTMAFNGNVQNAPLPDVMDIQGLIKNASDEEIIEYLKKNSIKGEKNINEI